MGNTIGNNIKTYRKNKGFTQEELADLLNVTPQAVSKWESENSLPDTAMLIPLAQILGVSTGNMDIHFIKTTKTILNIGFHGINHNGFALGTGSCLCKSIKLFALNLENGLKP